MCLLTLVVANSVGMADMVAANFNRDYHIGHPYGIIFDSQTGIGQLSTIHIISAN